ncbi:hypothetical protein [Methylobacterium sp. A54F]
MDLTLPPSFHGTTDKARMEDKLEIVFDRLVPDAWVPGTTIYIKHPSDQVTELERSEDPKDDSFAYYPENGMTWHIKVTKCAENRARVDLEEQHVWHLNDRDAESKGRS